MTIEFRPSNSLLTRDMTAIALTEAGYPIKSKTLATKASRGGGPPFQKFGSRPLYRWSDTIAWAENQLSAIVTSTAGFDIKIGTKSWASVATPAPNGCYTNTFSDQEK